MGNSIIIPNRLTWIDWAKVIAISFVVFGHTPIERGNFVQNFIVTFHMPFFFFISGYLTKKECFNKVTFKKYYHTLVVPYICYNLIFYPYWIARHYIESPDAGWYDYIKPIIGTLMLQFDTAYFESLNGVTWFIVSLLVMKIILAISNKFESGKYWIALLMVVTACVFAVNEIYRFVIDLPFVGFVRCCPFFFIGYFCKQQNLLSSHRQSRDMLICIVGIGLSVLFYSFLRNMYGVFSFGILYWAVCLSAIFGILSFCKLLDGVRLTLIENLSVGTIVIMGLHRMLIGATNFVLEKMLNINGEIIYPLGVAVVLVIVMMAVEYPIIILFKNRFPFMLGKSHVVKRDN